MAFSNKGYQWKSPDGTTDLDLDQELQRVESNAVKDGTDIGSLLNATLNNKDMLIGEYVFKPNSLTTTTTVFSTFLNTSPSLIASSLVDGYYNLSPLYRFFGTPVNKGINNMFFYKKGDIVLHMGDNIQNLLGSVESSFTYYSMTGLYRINTNVLNGVIINFVGTASKIGSPISQTCDVDFKLYKINI